MSRSSDPEDGLIQHVPGQPAPSVEDSEIPTKDKCGEAQRIVKKLHKEMSFAVVAACIISVLMDPFFFYIGLVDKNKKCFRTETRLKNVALISRSVADILFLTDMIFHIHKASNLVAAEEGEGGGKSKTSKYLGHVKAIASKLSLDSWVFITVDFFAILPIPQVIGAFWYYTAFERQLTCWYQASCSSSDGECRSIYCNGDRRGYSIGTLTMINKHCSLDDGAPFAYGMFHGALKSGYMERTISGGKVAYFMWWGLKNLSTNGTDIQTSNYLWENIFAIFLAILGMVLFAYFIGHMQQCLHSATEKKEVSDKVRKKEGDLREWIKRNFNFSQELVQQIWPDIKQKLEKDNDAMEILYCLPKYLLNHLRKKMLKKVLGPERFEKMKASEDKAWLENNIYTYLKPVIYTQKEFIFRVGEPLDSMFYIVDGTVIIYTTGNSSDFPSMIHEVLMSHDVYGDEQLMHWDASTSTNSLKYSLKNLPPSTENVRCHTKVEGFVLTAEDLKTVLFKFNEYQKEGERS